MIQPSWKKFLSHFFEFHVESASSEHNPHLYVSLNRGRYQLCTANAVYSHGDLYNNFSAAFNKTNLDKKDIKEVLILGFGLGSIPILLEKKFSKKYNYLGIEIDESVIYLASKYTIPEIASPLEIICTDAALFVDQCQRKFDLITVDLFLDDIIPDKFKQDEFLTKVKSLLTDKGLIMYNHLAYNKEDKRLADEFYKNHFQKVFPNSTFLKVRGNRMMMSDKTWVK